MMLPWDLDSLANAEQSRAPALFILSEKDEVVPVSFQRMILAKYAGERHVMDLANGTHNTGMDDAAYDEFDLQLDWLWQKAGLGKVGVEGR